MRRTLMFPVLPLAVRWCGALLLGLACATSATAADPQRRPFEASLGLGAAALVEGSATQAALVVSSPLGTHWQVGVEVGHLHASPRESGNVFQLVLLRRYGKASSRVRPYWLLGAGPFVGSGQWSDDAGVTASVGAGVQVFASRTLFLAPEARVGYIPAARLTLAIGYAPVGRRR